MSRSTIYPLTLALLIAAGSSPVPAAPSAATPAAPSAVQGRVITPDDAAAEARATPRSVYGPITSGDPAVRAQVKRLYEDRAGLIDDARARLAELTVELKAETDPDLRRDIHGEIAQQKRDLEIRSAELGLQIARLNEDAPRVAELERALDQMKNPEKYRPAPVGPSVQQERIRAMEASAANGGAR
jgi:hypothetical protein